MAEPEPIFGGVLQSAEAVGRRTLESVATIGYGATLIWQSLRWLILGRREGQPVRAAPVAEEMMRAGVGAVPIVSVLAITIGTMLGIQGIDALRPFGAEHQVTIGVALSVTREFAPLITGILIAGRSGSALAARIGTMMISQEVDALRVMGVNPVRFLVVPSFVAMVIMVPALALWSDVLSLLGAGLYITSDLDITMAAYMADVMRFLSVDDVLHGLAKATLFGALTAIVAVVNGFNVRGGAEGVGRATTSAVVQAITLIVLTDMLFVFATTR
jgi:phospholipid/cholesterol/gamma-HCH transport system permease protein